MAELADRETRAALPSKFWARLCCLPPVRCEMPNLLRIKLLAVRGLVKPGHKPYIVVRARDTRLATSRGRLVQAHSSAEEEWHFGDELMLRVTDASTVLDIRVYSSHGRDHVIGRWIMTMKCASQLPLAPVSNIQFFPPTTTPRTPF